MDVIDLCSSDIEVPALSLNINRSIPAATKSGAQGNPPTWSFSSLQCESDLEDGFLQSPRPSKKQKTQDEPANTAAVPVQAEPNENTLFDDFQDIDKISDFIRDASPSDQNDRAHRASSAKAKTAEKTRNDLEYFSEDDMPELGNMLQNVTTFSSKTAAILARVSGSNPTKRAAYSTSKPTTKRAPTTQHSSRAKAGEKNGSGHRKRLPSEERELRAAQAEAAKEEKQRIKDAEKEKKLLRKETEQEKKRQEKELKAKEKQRAADLAEINRSKIDRKMTTPEMIICLPKSIEGTSQGTQIQELIRTSNAEARVHDSAIPGIFKWQQKVTRDFDEELGHWVRADRVDECQFVLCLLSGEHFSDLASATVEDSETNQIHVTNIKSLYPNHQVIYMIEGLEAWIKRSRTAQNRAYQAAVRRIEEQGQETQQRGRKRKAVQVDEEAIEEALLELQVAHRCKIQQTINATETAEYIMSFTQQISLVRHGVYEGDASFCMETGQVSSGKNNEDTYLKILKQLSRITDKEAHGIASRYPNIVSLVKAFNTHGPLALENIPKLSASGNEDSRIGQAASRRLHKVFMGTDPSIVI